LGSLKKIARKRIDIRKRLSLGGAPFLGIKRRRTQCVAPRSVFKGIGTHVNLHRLNALGDMLSQLCFIRAVL